MQGSSRAAVIPRPGAPVEVREYALPEIEPGGVLLRTLFSEVCGTDWHLFHGKLAGVPYPLIPGHVSVGEITALRGEVCDVEGVPFREGEVVAFLDVHETCGSCWHCLVAKNSTRCPSRRVYGITYGAEDGLLGGWSEYIYLKPGVKLLRLPVDAKTYMAGGCGLPTAFHAVERAQIRMGDTVAIQGSGPVGLCSAVLARRAGAAKVIVIGAPEVRLEIAEAFGADRMVDVGGADPAARVDAILQETCGRGADVTIEACGQPSALREGVAMTRDAGTYVIVGQYTDNGTVELNPHLDINQKHLDVRGCWGSDFSHFYRGLAMMAATADTVPWQKMITATYGLHEANDALAAVSELKMVKALIDPWKEAS